MRRIALVLLLSVILGTVALEAALWRYYGEFNLPPAGTLPSPPAPDLRGAFSIAADDTRDLLYVGTTAPTGAATTAYVTRLNVNTGDPATTPSFTQVYSHSTETADTTRGIYGLSIDEAANILYISGDASSSIKFVDRILNPSSGSPTIESNWLAPTYRVGPCAVVSYSAAAYVYVGEFSGTNTIHVYKVSDKVEQVPAAASRRSFVRDIVVDPATYDIFQQSRGDLDYHTGGNPGNMAGYAASVLALAGDGLNMEFQALCRLGYTTAVTPAQVIWNTGDTVGATVDKLYVTQVDGSFAKDQLLEPTESPILTTWQAAADSAVLTIGAYHYLFAIDYSITTPRIVIFTDAPPPTPTPTPIGFADAKGWTLYE